MACTARIARGVLLLVLLLLLLLLDGCIERVAAVPTVVITFPQNHSWWQVDQGAMQLARLDVYMHVDGFRVPEDGYVRVSGEKIGEKGDAFQFATREPLISFLEVQAGSHFWNFELRHHGNDSLVAGAAPEVLHLEVVVPQHVALPLWRYELRQSERRPRVLVNLPVRRPVASAAREEPAPTPVCFVASTRGLFDGQKKMHLQIMTALQQANAASAGRRPWDVQVKAFEHVETVSPFARALQRLNISVQELPIQVRPEDLASLGVSTANAFDALVRAFRAAYHEDLSLRPAARDRWWQSIAATGLDSVEPAFVAWFWRTMAGKMASCAGGVLVLANTRSVTEHMYIIAARLAGVRAIVMELANLQPFPMRVDGVVGPSHFALHHPSVEHVVDARHRLVLAVGVDTERFRPRNRSHDAASARAFTIGYVGRLATEKSPGILLAAARLLQPRCPRCRVRMIGDGKLRAHLESLALAWNVSHIIEFVGGVYEEAALVAEIRAMDVVVSPTLIETLGIAPLEAMSCGVPVVGFASGGVGEYLEDNVNGLALQEPTAEALRDAIVRLHDDPALAQRLGRAARQTAVQRFAHRVGVQQYLAMYERLARPHAAPSLRVDVPWSMLLQSL